MSYYGYFVFFTKSIIIIQHINNIIIIDATKYIKMVLQNGFYRKNVGYYFMNSEGLPVRYRRSPLPPH